jgi:hypothetical protein
MWNARLRRRASIAACGLWLAFGAAWTAGCTGSTGGAKQVADNQDMGSATETNVAPIKGSDRDDDEDAGT